MHRNRFLMTQKGTRDRLGQMHQRSLDRKDQAVIDERRVGGSQLHGCCHRDLARQPSGADVLSKVEAVVLDPPHAGAAAQVAEIAESKVRRVVYVSCNPATLARDATQLRQAGFRLVSALPVDQFLWSARLESVVVFAR